MISWQRWMNPIGFIAIGFLAAGTASATDPINQSLFGAAVKGYDVVAYFTEAKPVEGSRDHVYEWQDATWRFSNEEHLAEFKQSPEKYAPQYGGYCAYAVSKGSTAPIDPEAWKIVDGKLYLNYSKDIQAIWEKDIPGYVSKADQNWPKILAGD